jgi:RHS repeat-associated protein
MSYPNSINTNYTYDAESRLTSLSARLGSTVVTDTGYLYDTVGNRTRKTTPGFNEDYGYDLASQLMNVKRTGATPGRWFLAYDKVGNRTSQQVDTAATLGNHDNVNRLLSRQVGGMLLFQGTVNEPAVVTVQGKPADVQASNSFTGAAQVTGGSTQVTVTAQDPSGNLRTNVYGVSVSGGSATYTYDAAGNLTQRVEGGYTWNYEWNATNQLTRVTKDSIELSRFVYDPFERRVEKVAGGTTYSYAHDREAIVRETRTGGTVLKYVHGPGLDEPLAREDSGGALEYYHADAIGSVLQRTNQAGAVIHSYRYDAWGSPEIGASEPGYAFTAREWDPEVGLYYYRARYYDANVSRFLSEDPAGFADGPNRYTYVRNQPANRIDPTGRQSKAEKEYCGDFRNWGNCSSGATCALAASILKWGDKDGSSDNAEKHCLWACCLARAEGALAAYAITAAHERGQSDPCKVQMDMTNNAAGIALGLANPNQSCFSLCDPQKGNLQCQTKQPPCRRPS